MTATFYVGDAIEVMSKLPEKSVDLILTSPPFLALRSYLPADHPDKHLEGGSQATPGMFIDWLVDVVEACDRVLAPHGSLCIELGDTYAGSGGAGGDYDPGGFRDGQPGFRGSGRTPANYEIDTNEKYERIRGDGFKQGVQNLNEKKQGGGSGWPLAKSLSLIPELFRLTLVYGTNPLTGRTTERWRLRNVVRWVRPNPPVGALGDKFRPATSELMVFCKSAKRYFDLDAVREPYSQASIDRFANGRGMERNKYVRQEGDGNEYPGMTEGKLTHAGAPPLDWWNIPPGGYSGTVMWTARKPVNPRESVGDIWRTTSADCPVHADQPDQAPTAPHGEPVSEDRPARSRGKGRSLVPGPNGDYVPIVPLLLPNLDDGSSDSIPLPSTPAATRRSKASSKKAPAPATSPPDTAFDRTVDRTDDTSTGLLFAEPHLDKPESRTSPDDSGEAQRGTSDHIVDTSAEPFDEACICSYWVAEAQYTSHYAVWPPELLIKPIKAMCPERVCRHCGEPSRRIVETERLINGHPTDEEQRRPSAKIEALAVGGGGTDKPLGYGRTFGTSVKTVGWSDCSCTQGNLPEYLHDQQWRPGVVLDPFGGSGTTALVATGHGRDCILIDLDERNYELALQRVGPFILQKGVL